MVKNTFYGLVMVLICWSTYSRAEENPPPRIAWYGDLQEGLAEARRSGRPILMTSAAPHCVGIPGVW